jgi:RNA polymerase sigma factor (sigma-70 family)
MASVEPTLLAAHIRRMVAAETEALTDAELVGRFAENRDASAFEVLVWRHGPMVWATCRRILRHQHDIEDAFQATFLALARTAGSIGTRDATSGWLHRVAVNAALKLKANRMLAGLPAEVADRREAEPDGEEFARTLDEELDRLPERNRVAFVLCCLEGMTSAEAARELGCPVGTVDSRLHAARTKLRDRLTRRGFGPGALAGLAAVAPPATTMAKAVSSGSGGAQREAVSMLATQVSRMMTHGTLIMKTAICAALILVLAGSVWAFGGPRDASTPNPAQTLRHFSLLVRAAPIPPGAGRGEGRIAVWRSGHPLSIRPDTKETAALLRGLEGKRGGLRLGPDRLSALVYISPSAEDYSRLFVRAVDGDGTEAQAQEIDVEGVALHDAFWGADGRTVYGYGLPIPKGTPAPAQDLTKDFVNWSFDMRTRKVERLKLPGNVSILDRSADGKAFLVLRYEKPAGAPGDYRLGLLPADGGEFVALTKASEATPGDFRFSPDGKFALGRMYVSEGSTLLPELVVFDLKTRTRTAVTVPKDAYVCWSCWSPDGQRIAFAWLSKPPHQENDEKRAKPFAKEMYDQSITVARPDGSDARVIHTESDDLYGSIDWR